MNMPSDVGKAPARPVHRAEAALYCAVILAAFVRITWAAVSASMLYLPGHELQGTFKLYPGLLPRLHNDLSDIQWRTFRESLPKLAAALTGYTAVSRLLARRSKGATEYCNRQHAARVCSGLLMLGGLHGSHALHVLLALTAQYIVAWHAAGALHVGALVIWAVPAAIWLLARTQDGIPFAMFGQSAAWLDSYAGPVRWQIGFNLVMLRMISWGMDLHWLRLQRRGFGVPPELSEKQRCATSHGEHWYGAFMYLGYCLYPPLYLTGPTITFNNFVCQARRSARITGTMVAVYAARLVLCILLLELLTHSIYANAFARFHLWTRLPAADSARTYDAVTMAAFSFFKLIFLWLKFLVIWRVARLFALLDGIDPPENMLRCVCNNYDISGFWRTWHASFNKWLIRYMYIPLGGQRWRLLNVWAIFTFVALWHDFEWHLLKWAWLMALLIAPEATCKSVLHSKAWQPHRNSTWLRHLCAAFAAVYITVMMAANLVGYGLGQSGVQDTLARVFGSMPTVLAMLASFYSAAQLMFEHRRITGT